MAESGAPDRVRIPRDRENDHSVDMAARRRAAVVPAGHTSRAAAVIAGDWFTSHDQLGRNRPSGGRCGLPTAHR